MNPSTQTEPLLERHKRVMYGCNILQQHCAGPSVKTSQQKCWSERRTRLTHIRTLPTGLRHPHATCSCLYRSQATSVISSRTSSLWYHRIKILNTSKSPLRRNTANRGNRLKRLSFFESCFMALVNSSLGVFLFFFSGSNKELTVLQAVVGNGAVPVRCYCCQGAANRIATASRRRNDVQLAAAASGHTLMPFNVNFTANTFREFKALNVPGGGVQSKHHVQPFWPSKPWALCSFKE